MAFIFMVHLSFYAIPLLICDVMYDLTTIPRVPSHNHSKVIDISCKFNLKYMYLSVRSFDFVVLFSSQGNVAKYKISFILIDYNW